MNIALIIIYVLIAINLLLAANLHGTPRTSKHNFWIDLISGFCTLMLTWWALGWRFI